MSFDAEGCAAANAAAAAVAPSSPTGRPCSTRPLIGPDQVAEALGGVGPQGRHAVELAADALHRALVGRRGLGAGAGAAAAAGERVLVALSGGVDSAVAALRERERGADVVAVTLKLWADRRTDAARSCCSPLAVLGARALATRARDPAPDARPRARVSRGGWSARSSTATGDGRTPNPCVICNGEVRIDAMLALAERLGCAALATGHYARIVDDGEGPLLAAAADPAKDQTYMLSGLRPRSLARLRFPLAELTKPEVRELAAARRASRWRGRPRARTSAFSPARASARSSPATAASPSGPGEIVDRAGRRLGEHRGHHQFTVGQRRGLRRRRARAALRALDRRRVEHRRGRLARRSSPPTGLRSGSDAAPAGRRVDRVLLRYHSRPLACEAPPVEAGEHAGARARARRARLRRRPGPDRVPAGRRRRRRPGDDRLSASSYSTTR